MGTRSVAIVGGGPAGLFLARMLGRVRPGTAIDVYERNAPDQAFGFGVSLSERTVRAVSVHDPPTHQRIVAAGTRLAGIEMRLPGDARRYDGFELFTVSRHALLTILREQAEEVGARLHFRREAHADHLDADVIALADGAASGHRQARAEAFGTRLVTGSARYIWLAAPLRFDAATFAFVPTEYGPMAVHAYGFAAGLSTVVVEMDEATWRRAGLAAPTGEIDDEALDLLSAIFADHLGGQRLVSNRSRWDRFTVVHNERWFDRTAVLLGDAAHTAHFTVGSGTKMALEDAIALALALHDEDDVAAAFTAYERQRRAPVTRTQRLAEPSMRWWESYGQRLHLPPAQFGLHFLTRTGAFSYLGLRRRCGERVDEAEAAYHDAAGTDPGPRFGHALAAPLSVGRVRLPSRLVRAIPASSAGDGLPTGVLRAEGDPSATVEFVELACPGRPDADPAADELVARARWLREHGTAAVLLRADFTAGSWWDTTLGYASRVRTEAAMLVAVYVPADWALDLTRHPDLDSWPARIHVALVSGRADLMVARPLTPAQLARAVERPAHAGVEPSPRTE